MCAMRWTGLAPWEFEFPSPVSLTSTFLYQAEAKKEKAAKAAEKADKKKAASDKKKAKKEK